MADGLHTAMSTVGAAERDGQRVVVLRVLTAPGEVFEAAYLPDTARAIGEALLNEAVQQGDERVLGGTHAAEKGL